MPWYSLYGIAARRITGECRFSTQNGEVAGPFECMQTDNGALFLRVQASAEQIGALRGPEQVMPRSGIRGTTKSGIPFSANPIGVPLFQVELSSTRPSVIDYQLTEAEVGEQVVAPSKRRYGLTNLIVTPNRRRLIRRARRISLPQWMEINLPNHTATIRPYPTYKAYRRVSGALRNQKICAITAAATLRRGRTEDIEAICALLSIAQGTMVNWLWMEEYEGARRRRLLLSNRVVRPHTGLHVISPNEPGRVPAFVEPTFTRFVSIAEDYRLNTVVRLMAEARSGLYSDLEARGVLLVVILEILTTAFAKQHGPVKRMSKGEFDRGAKVWRKEVEHTLKKSYPGRTDISEMMAFISGGLNRPSFGELLRAMSTAFGVPRDALPVSEQVRRVVKIRNSLVHDARFARSEDSVDAFFFLLKFVDRLILKLLGYSGKHLALQGREYRECDLT